MKRWLKEPLLHFLVAGSLLFGAYAWLNPPAPVGDSGSREVRIGAGEARWLTEIGAQRRREPTPESWRAGDRSAEGGAAAREAQNCGSTSTTPSSDDGLRRS
jgi:hypothetical protein